MNKIIISLFGCLCHDLGVQLLKPFTVDLVVDLGNLKNGLLALTEKRLGYSSWLTLVEYHQWVRRFNETFLITNHNKMRVWGLDDPLMFRKVYQLLSFALKIETPVTQQHEENYIQSFIENEACTRSWHWDRSNPVSRLAQSICRRTSMGSHAIIDSETCGNKPELIGTKHDSALDLTWENIQRFGRHGPGATYGGERGSDKNWFNTGYDQLELHFPWEGFFANSRIWQHFVEHSSVRSQERLVIARLALVPKTVKGPRGVFISPKEAIFCQIGIDGCIKDWVKRSWLRFAYNPTSQGPSRKSALASSGTREAATLDLKDASDRVPLELVRMLFHRQDYLALACTRPTYVELPNGKRHKLAMLSPMGDGKTFSVLSVVCIVLTVAAMLDYDGYLPTDRIRLCVLRRYAKKINVFGDDIIVPTRYFEAVCNALEAHNLRVNRLKSFVSGPFRESCGMDAFNGIQVTPLKLKRTSMRNEDFPSWVGLHNYAAIYYPELTRTIAKLRTLIESHWPTVGYTTDAIRCPWCLLVGANELDRLPDLLAAKHEVYQANELGISVDRLQYRRWGLSRREISRFRWNADLQRYEQFCLTGLADFKFADSLDPRWDLNYALFPKGGSCEDDEDLTARAILNAGSSHLRGRKTKVGSPYSQAYLDRLVSRTRWEVRQNRKTKLLSSWCEVI